MADDLNELLKWIADDSTVQQTIARTLESYRVNPGELLCRHHRDGRTYEWRGGDIAKVSEEAWKEVYPWLDHLPWPLCVLAVGQDESGLIHYVTRAS